MSHKLDDITLYYYPLGDLSKKFTVKQNVVSDLYVQFLNGYKPPKTSRISVTLDDNDYIRGYFGSILTVDAQFDKDNYWTLSEEQKNLTILNIVHRIALQCADKYNWEKGIFQDAYDNVLKVDFKYEFEGEKKISKDRQHKAAIQLKKDETCTTITVIFYDRSGNKIKSVELLKSFQHVMFYGNILKKIKWFNSRAFGWYTTNEEITIIASLDKDKSQTIINPKTTDREILEGFLKKITYHEFSSNEDIINWINR
jgi:hypothetical protein